VELRAYWAIIRRRFWIIIPIILIVALYAAYQCYHLYKTPGMLKEYQSATTIRVGLQADPRNSDKNYADYLSVSETLADTIVSAPVLNSQAFATEVSQQVQADMSQITQRYGSQPDLGNWQNPAAIRAAISTSRVHNLVTVTVNWSTPAGAWAIAHAVGEVSAAHLGTYLDYEIRTTPTSMSASPAYPTVSAQVIGTPSDPTLVAGPAANKPGLLLALLLIACIIAIALAFFVEYLDDRIRSKEEVEQLLQLPCLGEIPPAPTPGKDALPSVLAS
jgi:capsular polysaccharide biosynthesis protein